MFYTTTNEKGESTEMIVIDFSPIGEVTALYDDRLIDVFENLGKVRRPRASDINEDPDTGLFIADLTRCGGPILEGQRLKKDAEAMEVAWITENIIGYQAD